MEYLEAELDKCKQDIAKVVEKNEKLEGEIARVNDDGLRN